MKNSLKDVLLQILKARGILTIDNIEYICHHQQKKVDNGTRRMRELMASGFATAKRDERGCIMAYIYIQQEQVSVPKANYELQQELFKSRKLIG